VLEMGSDPKVCAVQTHAPLVADVVCLLTLDYTGAQGVLNRQ
jgi:hypothetical protein